MRVGWDTYQERLGPQGLRLVISCLLQQDALARLGDGDPGPGEDAVDRVAEAAVAEAERAEALLSALDAASNGQVPSPETWAEHEVREALAEMLREPGPQAAPILHRLARSHPTPLPAAEIRAAAELIAPEVLEEDPGTRPKRVAKLASSRAEVRELEQERRELEARVRQLESRLERALERAAQLDERLARRVEEVRGLRQEARAARDDRQRLEREAARLGKRVEELVQRRARERTGEITAALRRLTTEQRRAGAALEKLRLAERGRRDDYRGQARSLEQMAQLLERVASLEEAQARTTARAQEEILRQLAGLEARLDSGKGVPGPENRERPVRSRADKPRVGLFVDVQNMFYGAREKGARLDFEALLAAAGNSRNVVRAVAYLVESKDIDQSAFIHLLQMKAYEVKRKPLRIRPDRSMKGNWDLEMALDAMASADHLDVVTLATGDGDFVPLVRQLRLRGLRVEVYGFRASTAPDLREAADRFVAITKRLLRPLPRARQERRPAVAKPKGGG